MVITANAALIKPVVLGFEESGVPQDGQAGVRDGSLVGKQRSAEAQDGDILMGARLYSPALGRFLQIDPVPGGNASPYDYCTGDPVNCTDLDGNWGMPKWLKKTVEVVAKVAEVVATVVPGPIGAVAAAVSSVSYAATGNWEKAAEMAVTVAAAAVGVAAAVKVAVVGVKAAKAAQKANAILKDSRVGVRLYNAPAVGKKSLLFGDKNAPGNTQKRAVLLNRGKEAKWSIGWSARTNYKGVDATRKAHPAQSPSKKKQKARAVFRVRVGTKKVDLWNGPWR
ncbi:hypothetical protein OHV13_33730 [Kitasatospora purpeofusca]|uniref:RHS repeat-associated core domain-containing protein n=1 Tax=Kitasatospora purpeofusca TaxID=67352 RepID=UPI00325058D0